MAITKYRLVGIESIEVGDANTDLTNAVEIGGIFPGSCILAFALPDVTDLYIEEQDDPDISILSGELKKTLDFGVRDIKPDNMILAFGGTVASAVEKTIGPILTIAFVDGGAADDTITDTGSGFVAAGFVAGMHIKVSGSASNDGWYTLKTVAAGTLTLIASDKLSDEAAGESVTIVSGGQGWNSPTDTVQTQKSVRLKSKAVEGYRQVITIKNAMIRGSFDGRFIRTDSAVINFNVTVLKPTSGYPVVILPEAV